MQVSLQVLTTARVEAHSHNFAELSLVTSGSAIHTRHNRDQAIRTGDVFLVRDAQQHGLHDCQDLKRCMVIFDHQRLLANEPALAQIPGFVALFQLEPYLHRHSPANPPLQLSSVELQHCLHLCQRLRTELTSRLDGGILLSHHLLQELAIYLARCFQRGKGATQRSLCRVATAKKFIESHYQESLRLEDICLTCECSTNQLIRDFQTVTGNTPKRYLTHHRLNKACQRLEQGDTVLGTCLAVGFNDINAFTRQFKQAFGCTPGRWGT